MILIVYASSTKTEWCLLDRQGAIEQFVSDGINPLFQTRIEISRIIRLQLPQTFFTTKLSKIYFYGVGCSSKKMKNIIKAPMETQFKTPTIIEDNMSGIVHALFQNNQGIACILDTESCSCLYDGENITKTIISLGYILGDEGSSVALGKIFLADCLQGITPTEIVQQFYLKNKIDPNDIIEYIYTTPQPNRMLSVISYFLYENIDHPYIYTLIANNIKIFLERNILQYENFQNLPIRFVGPISKMYAPVLRDVAQNMGIYIDKIVESPLKGLIKYHIQVLNNN